MVPAPIERSEVWGHDNRSENLQHLQRRRLLSLAQRCGSCGTERSSEFGSVYLTHCPHARARGARRYERALRQTDLLEPPGRRRGCWSTSSFLFSGIVVGRLWSGADDGAQAVAADVGFAGSGRWRWCRRRSSAARYGVMTTDRKICSTYRGGACSRSRSAAAAAALNDHRNLAAYTLLTALTRAREAREFSSEL